MPVILYICGPGASPAKAALLRSCEGLYSPVARRYGVRELSLRQVHACLSLRQVHACASAHSSPEVDVPAAGRVDKLSSPLPPRRVRAQVLRCFPLGALAVRAVLVETNRMRSLRSVDRFFHRRGYVNRETFIEPYRLDNGPGPGHRRDLVRKVHEKTRVT